MAPRFEPAPYDPEPGGEFFGPDQDWWHNAVVSQFHPSWYVYASGYRRAANLVVDSLAEDRHPIDFLVYPVVFLFRQFIELTLKSVLRDATDLLDTKVPQRNNHDLHQLWALVEPLLNEAFGPDNLKEGDLQVISNCVQQFSKADPTSETYRYPVRKDGTPVIHLETHINIRKLRDEMDNAAKVLENVSNYLVVLIDHKREIQSDWGGP